MILCCSDFNGGRVFYHLITIPKYLGKAITIVESSMHELQNDEAAIEFYEGYIKDLPLAYDDKTVFEFTIYDGTRAVKVFHMDKPFPVEELLSSEFELAYA